MPDDKLPPGLQNLLRASAPIATTVTMIYVILENKFYFADLGGKGPNTAGQPPFPIIIPVAYSEVRDENGAVSSISKHNNMWLIGTGMRLEDVAPPKWWGDRDRGALVS